MKKHRPQGNKKRKAKKKFKEKFQGLENSELSKFMTIEKGVGVFDVPKMLKHLGLPVTELNKDLGCAALKEACAQTWPTKKVKIVRAKDN